MDIPVLILTVSFVCFLIMNVPIAISIGLSTFLTGLYVRCFADGASISDSLNLTSEMIAHKMATGIDQFSLLAIPFFI